jgi:hypothetical protein
MAVRLSAFSAGRSLPHRKIFWYSFLLETYSVEFKKMSIIKIGSERFHIRNCILTYIRKVFLDCQCVYVRNGGNVQTLTCYGSSVHALRDIPTAYMELRLLCMGLTALPPGKVSMALVRIVG